MSIVAVPTPAVIPVSRDASIPIVVAAETDAKATDLGPNYKCRISVRLRTDGFELDAIDARPGACKAAAVRLTTGGRWMVTVYACIQVFSSIPYLPVGG